MTFSYFFRCLGRGLFTFSFRRANQGLGFKSLPSDLSGARIWKISGLGRFLSVKVPGVNYWNGREWSELSAGCWASMGW